MRSGVSNNNQIQERIETAKKAIEFDNDIQNMDVLGYGFESVVLTDYHTVFKVFDKDTQFYLSHLAQLKGRFKGCRHIIADLDCAEMGGHAVLSYSYEHSIPYSGGREEEIKDFLVESALCGVIINDVKPINFRVFLGGLKFIDYGRDIAPFEYKGFLYMVQRAFLSIQQWGNPDFKTLAKKAIHDWNMLELDGFFDFFNDVYRRLLESKASFPRYELFHMPDDIWFDKVCKDIEQSYGNLKLFADWGSEIYADCGSPESASLSVFCQSENVSAIIVDSVDGVLANDLRRKTDNGQRIVIFCRNEFFDVNDSTAHHRRCLEDAGFFIESMSMSPAKPDANADFYSESMCIQCIAHENCGNDVSLMIKVCYQDGAMLDTLVRHIVSQLDCPDHFLEKFVVVDSKEVNFLREYSDAKKAETVLALDSLVKDGVIDRFLLSPTDKTRITDINRRWFGIECANTHSVRNIPVTPQLFGFESCKGDYILQADCDTIIVRRNRAHSYLADMKHSLGDNSNALSVSFDIAHPDGSPIADYKGECDGRPFVPEVRICLIDKKRFFDARPYPNEIENGNFCHSWYRSVEAAEQKRGLVSLRGGDPRTFYVHPQNDKKTNKEFWRMVLKTAESGHVPDIQYENLDLQGTAFDWSVPKIGYNFIFIIVGRNLLNSKFLRCWQSVINQTRDDWGAIIIDDDSENDIADYIKAVIEPYSKRAVFVDNPERKGILENIHHAIHDYCINPYSAIVILDMDDMLLSNYTLHALDAEYLKGADMVIGEALKVGARILPFIPDFKNPRNERLGDVWIHLRSFRKYLFDVVKKEDFMKDGTWMSKFTELTYTVPIAELARYPTHIHWPIYCWEPGHKRDEEHYRVNTINKVFIRGKQPYMSICLSRSFKGYSMPPGELLYTVGKGFVTFIRHAEKERADVSSIFSRITEDGKQASRIWGGAVSSTIGLILTSTVQRTIDTAWCIREGNHSEASIVPLDQLNGISIVDRTSWEVLKRNHTYQEMVLMWADGKLSDSIIEPYERTMVRLLRAIWGKIFDKDDETVLVITHDHVIWHMLRLFGNLSKHKVPYLGGLTVSKEEIYKKIIELESLEKRHEFIHTSSDVIEIDITYRCDFMCFNCDRSCRQAPADDDMPVEQIERFISDSEKEGREWKRIRIMGGEPMLHPEIDLILNLFDSYGEKHPETMIELYTNGIGKDSESIVPAHISIHNTFKVSQCNTCFEPYNLAAVDLLDSDTDCSGGCWITRDCGIGLNRYGYYPCAAGAAVDRVFGFDIGCKGIPSKDDDMIETRFKLCRYCGHHLGREYEKPDLRVPLSMEVMSQSWTDAYSKYRQKKPKMTTGGRLH